MSLEAPDRLPVRADAQQLRGAIANLVRNALAYSPTDTPVRVVVDERNGSARVRVKDRGPGIPANERRLIFDPFARGHVGQTVRGGKGLGLFIAQRIVEAHEGAIHLRSGRSGATFCVEIPLVEERRSASAS